MGKIKTLWQRAQEFAQREKIFDEDVPALSSGYQMGANDERRLMIEWHNAARTFPKHERKVLLMNRRAGVEYSTGWYDRDCEQWHVDDRTMIAVDYWREIHE